MHGIPGDGSRDRHLLLARRATSGTALLEEAAASRMKGGGCLRCATSSSDLHGWLIRGLRLVKWDAFLNYYTFRLHVSLLRLINPCNLRSIRNSSTNICLQSSPKLPRAPQTSPELTDAHQTSPELPRAPQPPQSSPASPELAEAPQTSPDPPEWQARPLADLPRPSRWTKYQQNHSKSIKSIKK